MMKMKNTASYIFAALLAAGAAVFPTTEAHAIKHACVKNIGGGGVLKFRIRYKKPIQVSTIYGNRYERKFTHSAWAKPVLLGRTGCIRLSDTQLPKGAYFSINVNSVSIINKPDYCGFIRRNHFDKGDEGGSDHVSFDVYSTALKATCKGGPYFWNKCNKCTYNYGNFRR